MNKARLVSLLGICVILLPYLGFPNSWRKVLFVCVGIMLMYLGYYIHRTFYEKKSRSMNRTIRRTVKPSFEQNIEKENIDSLPLTPKE